MGLAFAALALAATLLTDPTELRARSHDGHVVAVCENPDGLGDLACRLRVQRDGVELWTRDFPLRLEALEVTDAGQIVALTEPALHGLADAKSGPTRGSWVVLDMQPDRARIVDLPLRDYAAIESQLVLPFARRALLRTRLAQTNGAAESWCSFDLSARSSPEWLDVFSPSLPSSAGSTSNAPTPNAAQRDAAAPDTATRDAAAPDATSMTLEDVARDPQRDELLFVWQARFGKKPLSTVYELRSPGLDVLATCIEDGKPPAALISLGADGFEVWINGNAFRRRLPSFEREPESLDANAGLSAPPARPLELARTIELGDAMERGVLPPLHVQGFAWLDDGTIECIGQGFAHGPLIQARFDGSARVSSWRVIEQPGDAKDVYADWVRDSDGTWIGSHWHGRGARLALLEPGAAAVELRGIPWGAKSWQVAPLANGNCAILREALVGAWSLEIRTREHKQIAAKRVADAEPKRSASLAVRGGDRIGVWKPDGARIDIYDMRGEAIGALELATELSTTQGRLLASADGWWLQYEQRLVRIGDDGVERESVACEPRTTIEFDAHGEPWSRRAADWPGALTELRQVKTGRVLPFASPRTPAAPFAAASAPDAERAVAPIGYYFHALLDGRGQLWGYDWAADALHAFDATGRSTQHVRLPPPADGGLGEQYWRGFPCIGDRIWLFDPTRALHGAVIDCASGVVTAIERPSSGRARSPDGAYDVEWGKTSFEIRTRDGVHVATIARNGSARTYHHLLDVSPFRDAHWAVTSFSSPLLHGGPHLRRELYSLDGRYRARLDDENPCGARWSVSIEDGTRTTTALVTRRRDGARFSAPVPRLLQVEYQVRSSAWIAAEERELWVLDRPARRVNVYALPSD